jgi:hypothetical protein
VAFPPPQMTYAGDAGSLLSNGGTRTSRCGTTRTARSTPNCVHPFPRPRPFPTRRYTICGSRYPNLPREWRMRLTISRRTARSRPPRRAAMRHRNRRETGRSVEGRQPETAKMSGLPTATRFEDPRERRKPVLKARRAVKSRPYPGLTMSNACRGAEAAGSARGVVTNCN